MALADKNPGKNKPGNKCGVCAALENGSFKNPEDADLFVEWMKNPAIAYRSISQALHDDPDCPDLSQYAIARHTRGECNYEPLR